MTEDLQKNHSLRLIKQNMFTTSALIGLFFAALGAATLLPMGSEAIVATLINQAQFSTWLIIATASVGNVIGSIINWWLGRQALKLQHKSWFPLESSKLQHYQTTYQRWGHWSLLLSWAPIIGDPLTVAAGFLKEPLWRFILLVSFAKTGRYCVIAFVTLQLTN